MKYCAHLDTDVVMRLSVSRYIQLFNLSSVTELQGGQWGTQRINLVGFRSGFFGIPITV